MKKLIRLFTFIIICSITVFGQKDTVFVDNFVDFNQKFLSELSPSVYEGRLINRASMEDITLRQLMGKDNKPHNWANWMFLYSDLYNAYVNNTNRLTVEEFYELLEKKSFDYRYPDTSENIRPMPEEVVHRPFALIIEDVYKLKDSVELVNYAEVQNNKLVPVGEETDLYEKIVFKSAAVLDVYSPQGYSKGKLHFEPDFVVHSPNIVINNISVDVGNGFTSFKGRKNTIDYTLGYDTTFAKAAVSYSKDGVNLNDTLKFILSVQPPRSMNKSNPLCVSSDIYDNTDFYDFHFSYSESFTSLQFDVGVIIGCGNESQVETLPHPYDDFPYFPENFPIKNIRRPIIIMPPYRPDLQDVSMGFYYCKYNIDGFIDEMVAKGYDVIIIREEPGNKKIRTNGNLLADFITSINEIKQHNYPDESWENVVFGFSAGGQHARYALTALEKRHMQWGTPHHHTRLYAPIDSPHNGANVPVSMQTTFWEYRRTGNPVAIGVYGNLADDASKDMLTHHISSNLLGPVGPGTFLVEQTPTYERTQLMDELKNDFNHQLSHSDQRKSFPTFSRNIAVSMGRFDQDYDQEYGLGSRELLFRQIVPALWVPGFGFRSYNNALFASPKTNQADPETILRRMEVRGVGVINPIPAVITRFYTTNYSPGYDQARGGHKNVFYDGLDDPWAAQFIGAVQVMRSSAFLLGVKHYKSNVNFMPLTSAFAIKDGNTANVLQNFNPQEEDMMFQKFGFDPDDDKSNHFGYPHLGRPNDHFEITPFEAIYADDNTYEHIDPINTVQEGKEDYLDSIRVFLRDEIEGENFYLQNKTIGQNHVNWLPDFEYKAWYKADKELHIGYEVTPKTNKGDYIIEETGNITVYAGDSVIIKPGFHTKPGSTFHAFIKEPECVTSKMSEISTSNDNDADEQSTNKRNGNKVKNDNENNNKKVKVYPNPNSGSFTLEVTDVYLEGEFMIFDTYGKKLYLETIKRNKIQVSTQLNRGIYFVALVKGNNKHVEKIVIQ